MCKLQKTAGESVGQRIIDKISKLPCIVIIIIIIIIVIILIIIMIVIIFKRQLSFTPVSAIIILFKSLLRQSLFKAIIENPLDALTKQSPLLFEKLPQNQNCLSSSSSSSLAHILHRIALSVGLSVTKFAAL